MAKETKKRLTGLPEPEDAPEHPIQKVGAGTVCQKCGNPGRVVSNSNGVNVFCGPCKIHWPISSAPLAPTMPPIEGRGLKKRTLVDPDWNRAFEDD